MKKKYLFLLLLLCFNVSLIHSQVYMYSINDEGDTLEYSNDTIGEPDIDDPIKGYSCDEPDCDDTWGDKDIRICNGFHPGGGTTCLNGPLGRKLEFTSPIFRVLKFNFLFNQTAIYDISSTGNQDDWNKGPKIYSMENSTHKYYLAIGWRWNLNHQAVEVGLYGHIDHSDGASGRFALSLNQFITEQQIDNVDDPETENIEGSIGWPIELIFSTKGYFVSAGYRGVAIRRYFETLAEPEPGSENLYEGTKMRRGAWFGGDEVAPHKIHLWTNDWEADCESTWWNETTYKGFSYSEWYSGEVLEYYASDMIEFNPDGFWSQAGHNSYIKINSGAEVYFRSPDFVGEGEVLSEVGAIFVHEPCLTTCTNTGEEPATYTCPEEGSRLVDTTDYLTGEMLLKNDKFTETFEIHPNPNNGNMQIAYEIPENTCGRFEVYNMMGEKLFSYSLLGGKNTFSISRSDLNQGIYYYRATAGNKQIATDKIVVIK